MAVMFCLQVCTPMISCFDGACGFLLIHCEFSNCVTTHVDVWPLWSLLHVNQPIHWWDTSFNIDEQFYEQCAHVQARRFW